MTHFGFDAQLAADRRGFGRPWLRSIRPMADAIRAKPPPMTNCSFL